MEDTRTPRVKLVLNLQEEKPCKPQVLKERKRSLLCEYNGMVFKQPREEPVAQADNALLNCTRSPNASVQRLCQQRSSSGAQQGPPDATPAHQGFNLQQPGSLDVLCAGWFEAEAQGSGSEEVAAALQDICSRFLAGGAGLQLQAKPQSGLTPAAVNQEVDQADYQVDLEARKAGLRARLAGYQKEIADWEGLVREAEQYGGEPGDATVGEVACPESDAAEPADVVELKKMHVDLHRHLTMQAEGLCKLVGDVEELVGRANRTAHSLQAEYHQEKFRAFPHVDSPARLIKEIVKPPVRRMQQH